MIDIAWSHLIIVALVALIFLGPEELPVVLRAIGRWVGWVKRTIEGMTQHIQEDSPSSPSISSTKLPDKDE